MRRLRQPQAAIQRCSEEAPAALLGTDQVGTELLQPRVFIKSFCCNCGGSAGGIWNMHTLLWPLPELQPLTGLRQPTTAEKPALALGLQRLKSRLKILFGQLLEGLQLDLAYEPHKETSLANLFIGPSWHCSIHSINLA